jgi:hypothetical protein
MKKVGTLLLLASLSLSTSAFAANPKIAEYAVSPITQKGYPKLYAEWGAAKIKEVNGLQPLAAEKVSASSECDKVEIVGLSTQRSSPKGEIVFFVDCANGKRFYVSKTELKSASSVQSQEKKMSRLSDQQSTEACERAIKAQLANPMTFSRNFGTNSVYRAPSTGNVVVEFVFDAKNNIGNELPHKARCVFNDQGLQEARISK